MMAGSVMDEAMNQLFEYHNYIVCSKGTVEFNGKQHTVSFGILGTVYTMNADDMVKALEGADNLQLEEMNSSSSDDTSSIDGTNDESTSLPMILLMMKVLVPRFRKDWRQGKPGHG